MTYPETPYEKALASAYEEYVADEAYGPNEFTRWLEENPRYERQPLVLVGWTNERSLRKAAKRPGGPFPIAMNHSETPSFPFPLYYSPDDET